MNMIFEFDFEGFSQRMKNAARALRGDRPDFVQPKFKSNSIEESFQIFHELNPSIYLELVRMTRLMRAKGRKKIGMKMLFEALRWNYMVSTDDPETEFKLNNNFTSRYVRLIAEQEPELASMFFRRLLRTK